MRQEILLSLITSSAVWALPATHGSSVDGINIALPQRRGVDADASTGDANLAGFLQSFNKALKKYHSPQTLPSQLVSRNAALLKRANNEQLIDQVNDNEDVLYYGSGTVGTTKPQTFQFDFDTGSSDTFVPGPSCGSTQGCPGSTKYNQGGVDEHNTTVITYGSGQVSGENYFDSVTIAGLTATHHNVISLNQAQGFSDSDSDSLMGMAFQSIANSGQPPFFQTLIAEGKVSTQEFAFYLGRAQSGTQGASQLTLGGRDSSKYKGAITQVPVSSQTYWQVALDQATVNGNSAGLTTKGQAAIDTGTTLIIAPTIAAAAIFLQIPGSFPIPLVSGSPEINIFGYPCNYNGKVALQFAGKQFQINPLDFNFGQLTPSILHAAGLDSNTVLAGLANNTALGGTCLAGIAAADLQPTENLYVVGDAFIKNWYSVFSFNNNNGQPSVSFAAAVNNQ